MGGHRQRTVLNEPAHTRHLRDRDPTEGPGLGHIGLHRRSALHIPEATAPTSQRRTEFITNHLSDNHLPTQFFVILREVTTKWFT